MAFDLPRLIKRLSRRRRAITFRPITPSQATEARLSAIYVKVVRGWHEAARTRLLPAYAGALREAKAPTGDSLVALDDVRGLGAEMESADNGIYRLILSLTPDLKDWTVKAEERHRATFVASAKTAAGVDLGTILSPFGIEETLQTIYERNLSLIRSVSDEVRSKIGDIIFKGFQARTPLTDIQKLIAEATGLARDRALRIASDQTTKLSAQLDQERQQEIGITQFIWRHSGKVHFRPEHKARDGKVYSWEKNNLAGDLPGVAINCGCKAQAFLDLEE